MHSAKLPECYIFLNYAETSPSEPKGGLWCSILPGGTGLFAGGKRGFFSLHPEEGLSLFFQAPLVH